MEPYLKVLISMGALIITMAGGFKLSTDFLERIREPYKETSAEVSEIESREDVYEYLETERNIRSMVADAARNNPANYNFNTVIYVQQELRELETEEIRSALERRKELRQEMETENNRIYNYGTASGVGIGALGYMAYFGTFYLLNRREKRRKQQPYTPETPQI